MQRPTEVRLHCDEVRGTEDDLSTCDCNKCPNQNDEVQHDREESWMENGCGVCVRCLYVCVMSVRCKGCGGGGGGGASVCVQVECARSVCVCKGCVSVCNVCVCAQGGWCVLCMATWSPPSLETELGKFCIKGLQTLCGVLYPTGPNCPREHCCIDDSSSVILQIEFPGLHFGLSKGRMVLVICANMCVSSSTYFHINILSYLVTIVARVKIFFVWIVLLSPKGFGRCARQNFFYCLLEIEKRITCVDTHCLIKFQFFVGQKKVASMTRKRVQ